MQDLLKQLDEEGIVVQKNVSVNGLFFGKFVNNVIINIGLDHILRVKVNTVLTNVGKPVIKDSCQAIKERPCQKTKNCF